MSRLRLPDLHDRFIFFAIQPMSCLRGGRRFPVQTARQALWLLAVASGKRHWEAGSRYGAREEGTERSEAASGSHGTFLVSRSLGAAKKGRNALLWFF